MTSSSSFSVHQTHLHFFYTIYSSPRESFDHYFFNREYSWPDRSMFSIVVVLRFGLLFLISVSVLELYNEFQIFKQLGARNEQSHFWNGNGNRTVDHHRKLLTSSELPSDDAVSNRFDELCSKDDIVIYQGPTTPLPNGIPTYTVQILNVCVSSSCSISNIHVSCGWFSSARMINPKVFRRVFYDDCVVNNGQVLSPGDSLSFQYANSFQYPLSVSSVTC